MANDAKGKKCAVCGRTATHIMGSERKPVCPQHGIGTLEPQIVNIQRRLGALQLQVRVGGGELIARTPSGYEMRSETLQLLAELQRHWSTNPEAVADLLIAAPPKKTG